MSMRTKVVMILVGDGIKQSTLVSDINTEIQRNESKGWNLRGTPEYVEEAKSMMLTFERPAIGDSEKTSEAGIPVELPLDIKVPKLD